MKRSLRHRLIVAITLITFCASAIVGIALGRFTQAEFQQFLEVEMEVEAIEPPDLSTLDGALESGDRQQLAEALMQLEFPARLVMFSPDGVLIADTRPQGDTPAYRDGDLELVRSVPGPKQAEERIRLRGSIPLPNADSPAAILFIVPDPGRSGDRGPGAGFTRRVGLAQAIGVIVVSILAALIAWLLSRQILGPVDRLTSAARRLSEGDLSQRVEVVSTDEIGQLSRAFNSMAANLERQEIARRNLTGDVAHELRTPLTHLRCKLESVQDGLVALDQTLVHDLHAEIVHLGRLVDDLQELSLAEAGRLPFHPREVRLDDVLPGVVGSMPGGPDRPHITVEARPDELPTMFVDADRLRQVLRNLLENALRYGRRGGRVRIVVTADVLAITISVEDDGPGIPAGHEQKIFERFHRTDASRTRETGGAGLGLAITRELVQGWGGQLGVSDAVEGGARFWFTVPRNDSQLAPSDC